MTSLNSLPGVTSKRPKALVTGDKGFIGSNFREYLEDRGWEVAGCDIKQPGYRSDALEHFRQSEVQYDLIVHAAYNVGGRVAIDGVNDYFAKNLELDASLFQFALRTRPRNVLYFSSSAVYPVRLQDGAIPHLLRESDADPVPDRNSVGHLRHPEPDANYGWAKLTGERMVAEARKQGVNYHVVRPFSGYGEDQTDDYPLPAIVGRALDRDLEVWGPPEQARDWIHIEDIILGCLRIMEANDGQPVNLCTGKARTMAQVLQIAYNVAHGTKISEKDIRFLLDKPTGVIHRVGHPERFFKYHRPTVTLREGIERVLATY